VIRHYKVGRSGLIVGKNVKAAALASEKFASKKKSAFAQRTEMVGLSDCHYHSLKTTHLTIQQGFCKGFKRLLNCAKLLRSGRFIQYIK
jgi:hypothetical protein